LVAGLLITAGVTLLVLNEKPVEKHGNVHPELHDVNVTGNINTGKVNGNINTGKTDKNIAVVKNLNEVNEAPAGVKENIRKPDTKTQGNGDLTAFQSAHPRDRQGQVTAQVNPSGQSREVIIKPDAQQQVPAKVEPSALPQVAATVPPVSGEQAAKTKIEEKSVPTIAPSINQEQKAKTEPRKEEKTTKSREQSNRPGNWNISTGVYCTPEWMFNTLNGDKFANNMGVEGTFHFGPYSVRTGVGLSITTGSNEMLVQTSSYLGSYASLDSVVFRWNDNHTSLVPTLFTSGTNVYDTALRYNYSYIKKRYTYLQVPLVLGYDFWRNRWLSLGARAGAVMSVLLKSENMTESFDPGKDKIISINNISPDRIQLNWQAVGGINAAFRLSRRFSIELEPNVRYYFNSVYESSELVKKPWSVGVRTAFLITF